MLNFLLSFLFFKTLLSEGIDSAQNKIINAQSLKGFFEELSDLSSAKDKKVVSIEGKDGTEKMLKNSKNKKFRNHGVLVKFPKKKQDLRVDLPTIGLKTLKQCKTAGLKGVVIKSKQNIFLDKNKCIKFANKNKMFITAK